MFFDFLGVSPYRHQEQDGLRTERAALSTAGEAHRGWKPRPCTDGQILGDSEGMNSDLCRYSGTPAYWCCGFVSTINSISLTIPGPNPNLNLQQNGYSCRLALYFTQMIRHSSFTSNSTNHQHVTSLSGLSRLGFRLLQLENPPTSFRET